MKTKKKTMPAKTEPVIEISEVALFASVLGNLKQSGDNEGLRRSLEALRQVVMDWQIAYRSMEAQLDLALRTNEEQNRLVSSLREQLRRAQARVANLEREILQTRVE